MAAAPPEDPDALVAPPAPPPVALPDLAVAPAAGVRVLARAADDPVALPDLPRGAGGGEADGGGGRGCVDGCSGAAGFAISWIAKGRALALGAGGGGGGPGV
ncbi:MAG: hypothetical protein VYB33_01630 [Pseudomonadota bacterium]|nr:hypothetical protein [Pseudomonadota bacterium]